MSHGRPTVTPGHSRYMEFGHTRFPWNSWGQRWQSVTRNAGLRAALETVRVHREVSIASAKELPELFRKHGVTHLVLGQNQYQGAALARLAVGLPFINVTCTVPLNRDPRGAIAPPSETWPPIKS